MLRRRKKKEKKKERREGKENFSKGFFFFSDSQLWLTNFQLSLSPSWPSTHNLELRVNRVCVCKKPIWARVITSTGCKPQV